MQPAVLSSWDGEASLRPARRSGGTGRRAGLKIRWGSRPVWVRLPPSAQAARIRRDNKVRRIRAKKLGVLTGGGDCPGLNAVIRAVGRRSRTRLGGDRRPRGLGRARRERARAAGPARDLRGSSRAAGRFSGRRARTRTSSRAGSSACLRHFQRDGLDALVAIGGEDTLGVATRLFEEHGFPVVGVPKTIDNDLSAPTTRSASTRRSRSARRRSTGCTRPRSRTTA